MPSGFSDQERIYHRLKHVLKAIDDIYRMLDGKDITYLENDWIARAAYERLLEIICEASRYVTSDLREKSPEVPWRKMGDLGNRLRHAYDLINLDIIWDIYAKGDLATVRAVALRLRDELTPPT
jgi:uncharacterized protein with HEPN domain